MILTTENLLLIGSVLLFISVLSSKTSFRLGLPSLALFLLVGMLAGSDGPGGIYFDDPGIAQFLGTMALNFILFSGGLDTRWKTMKPVLWQGVSLSTLGVAVTAFTVGAFVHFCFGVSWIESLLLGSIISSTDAAAVFSILRSQNLGLKNNLGRTLELESGSNDPMAYFLTITFTQLAVNPGTSYASLIPFFFMQMAIGGFSGLLLGKLAVRFINRVNLSFDGLYPVLLTAIMFFVYSATNLAYGNGFLAVYIAAVVMGNGSFIHKRSLLRFFDGQAWLMQIIMFITLGLLVFPSQMLQYLEIAVLVSIFMIFAARPLAVFISLVFFRVKARHKVFLSWVGLRGAVPIVFATYPLLAGVQEAQMIFNVVFFISLTSVLLQGTSLSLVARWLGLSERETARKDNVVELEWEEDSRSSLEELVIGQRSVAVDRRIVDLGFPTNASIVLITRDGVYIAPKGNTRIRPGDKLLVMAEDNDSMADIRKILCG